MRCTEDSFGNDKNYYLAQSDVDDTIFRVQLVASIFVWTKITHLERLQFEFVYRAFCC